MRRYAVYRPLYGEDFIVESIRSVLDVVDRVFFCYTDTPLAGVRSCTFKGQPVVYPLRPGKTLDRALEQVQAIGSPKIECIYQDGRDNQSQFTRLMNDVILENYERPDVAFLIEPDHVFARAELSAALDQFERGDHVCASTRQVELWRLPDWRIPYRERTGTVFWNLRKLDRIPPTARQAEPLGAALPFLDAQTHNLGFCVSPESMYWKHVLALGFSRAIGDSIPNEDWYEEKWLLWDPLRNNANLEISRGHEHLIPRALPYPREALPELIREKYGYGLAA